MINKEKNPRVRYLALFCTLPFLLTASPLIAAESRLISQSAQSWDGTKLHYPAGEAQLSIVQITIKPGESTEFHCHPVPSAGYVLSGKLEVELGNGKTKRFSTGEVITEVVTTLHRGMNLSAEAPVELIVFYAGATHTPLSFHGKDIEGKCKKSP